MQTYIQRGELQVANELDTFLTQKALPGTEVSLEQFWSGFENLIAELMPVNQQLLAKRDALQARIDDYCRQNPGATLQEYKAFLKSAGYLCEAPQDFSISTDKVDPEIATLAGPQLVVPINNSRYALNAANARWGSLYDAVYGTDVISEQDGAEKGRGYNPIRGQKVVEYVRGWLDVIAPLATGSHKDAVAYEINQGSLLVGLKGNAQTSLVDPEQFVGFKGEQKAPHSILLVHNGLHAEIQLDESHPIGQADPAGVKDVVLEAALTTIMDCEDSVAAVDAEDKILVYQNWLGLMKGTLNVELKKGEQTLVRSLEKDRQYQDLKGDTFTLPGRSLMFVRNVGHLMTNDAITYKGEPIPEGIMDAMFTSLIGKHDLLRNGEFVNSKTGSIYIVKPKMHGPEEVAFANTLFNKVEKILGLPANTLKMGIMDEERRTSVNLKSCIYEARERAVFINTGFLDRTGDEIHTSMELGAFAPKAQLKALKWINAYEQANVQTGLRTGMSGKAQIGKGMWPIPDQMNEMMKTKIGHPKAGANTAWVPSPTAATLHSLHYHQQNVFDAQASLANPTFDGLDDILSVPLLKDRSTLNEQDIQRELDNNVQGILGYVVRWVHQGIGCSKVPDINNVGLMEDRATLRISSQHVANWLAHGLLTKEQIDESMERMAVLVDKQNSGDPEYIAMAPALNDSIAYQAAQELIFAGKAQPNGYTEPVLHAKRREMKAKLA